MAKLDKLPKRPFYCGEIIRSKDVPEHNFIDIKVKILDYNYQIPIWGTDRFEIYKKVTKREFKENDILNELAFFSKQYKSNGKPYLKLTSISNDKTRNFYIDEKNKLEKQIKI